MGYEIVIYYKHSYMFTYSTCSVVVFTLKGNGAAIRRREILATALP